MAECKACTPEDGECECGEGESGGNALGGKSGGVGWFAPGVQNDADADIAAGNAVISPGGAESQGCREGNQRGPEPGLTCVCDQAADGPPKNCGQGDRKEEAFRLRPEQWRKFAVPAHDEIDQDDADGNDKPGEGKNFIAEFIGCFYDHRRLGGDRMWVKPVVRML